MNNKPNKIFVSVYRSNLSNEVNTSSHMQAKVMLLHENIPYAVVNGVYKGIDELTIMLSASSIYDHNNNLNAAYNLALLFNQESILEVCNDDTAYLHWTNGSIEKLGTFQECSKSEAIESDSYTFEPISKRYFRVVK